MSNPFSGSVGTKTFGKNLEYDLSVSVRGKYNTLIPDFLNSENNSGIKEIVPFLTYVASRFSGLIETKLLNGIDDKKSMSGI